MPVKAETFILMLQNYVGQTLDGSGTHELIDSLPNDHSIDITITVSCARKLGTEQIMAESRTLSVNKLKSNNEPSRTSNPNTSSPSQPTNDGTDGLDNNFSQLECLQLLQAVVGISLGEGTKTKLSDKLLHMIRKEA